MARKTDTRYWKVQMQQTLESGVTLEVAAMTRKFPNYEEVRDYAQRQNTRWAKTQSEVLEPTYWTEPEVEGGQRVVHNLRPELAGAVFHWVSEVKTKGP